MKRNEGEVHEVQVLDGENDPSRFSSLFSFCFSPWLFHENLDEDVLAPFELEPIELGSESCLEL